MVNNWFKLLILICILSTILCYLMIIYKKTEYSGFKDNGIESVRDKLKLQKYSKDIKIKKVINELELEIFYNNIDYNNSEFFNFQITNFTENEFGFNLFHKALLIDKIYLK